MRDDDLVVRAADLRAAKVCLDGAERFLARHGHDWKAFVRGGIPAAALLQTGDAIAARVVETARARAARAEQEAR